VSVQIGRPIAISESDNERDIERLMAQVRDFLVNNVEIAGGNPR
jgi:hypothetical protein